MVLVCLTVVVGGYCLLFGVICLLFELVGFVVDFGDFASARLFGLVCWVRLGWYRFY